jgi:hypothetical protein
MSHKTKVNSIETAIVPHDDVPLGYTLPIHAK